MKKSGQMIIEIKIRINVVKTKNHFSVQVSEFIKCVGIRILSMAYGLAYKDKEENSKYLKCKKKQAKTPLFFKKVYFCSELVNAT